MDFYSMLARHYARLFPVSEQQSEYLKKQLGSGSAVLDVGCAVGLTSGLLQRAGYQVTGIDPSEEMLAIAHKNQPGPEYLTGGMLDLAGLFAGRRFDGVICMGNTLVHLGSHQQMSDFTGQVSALLNPGGRLIIQLLNYDLLGRERPQSLEPITSGTLDFLRSYDYSGWPQQLIFRGRLKDLQSGHAENSETVLCPVMRSQLEKILTDLGFLAEFHGDFMAAPWTVESRLTIVSARRG